MKIEIHRQGQCVHTFTLDVSVELGRQRVAQEELYAATASSKSRRIAIAPFNEREQMSRRQLQLEPLGNRVLVTNISKSRRIHLGTGGVLAPRAARELLAPAKLAIGENYAVVILDEKHTDDLRTLDDSTHGPVGASPATMPTPNILTQLPDADSASLVLWLQTIIRVAQSAASTNDFFECAARGIVELVGLDSGGVLLLDEKRGVWNTQVRHVGGGERFRKGDWKPANRIIERVVKEKRTFWRECRRRPPTAALPQALDAAELAWDDPSQIQVTGVDPAASPELRSLEGIQAVVAAPILGRDGEVVGILYGDRVMADDRLIPPRMTKLDAMLVETLACATAAGLARLDQEKAALSAEVRFGQFFSPELSRHLASNPDMLVGRDTEVTVLFCDIRGFSRVTERLDPALTLKWINDVLGELSDCVIEQQGVLVDYVGDELVAMWGAPEEQPDHALLAVGAALDMLGKVGKLDATWQAEIGEPTRFGIGINTGMARVGNTGSHCKFKYGPLGNAVNLASRVQGATKYFKTDLLITAATHARLEGRYAARRLCQVRVVNIVEPVELYELRAVEDAAWHKLRQTYEQALRQFEQQDFIKAKQTAGGIIAEFPDDEPSLILMDRARSVRQGQAFDPAVELPSK